MNRLPPWVITEHFPKRFDVLSGSATEMVAVLYGCMDELVKGFDEWKAKADKMLEEYSLDHANNYDLFTRGMRDEFQKFIDTVELKLKKQDKKLEGVVKTFTENAEKYVSDKIDEMIANGEITAAVEYDAENEELTIRISGNEV